MNFENSKDLPDLDLVRYLAVTLTIAFWKEKCGLAI